MSEPKLKEIHDARGRLIIREWLIGDKLHREDGPAWIEYDRFGNIKLQEYYINDKKMLSEDFEKYRKIGELIKKAKGSKKISL